MSVQSSERNRKVSYPLLHLIQAAVGSYQFAEPTSVCSASFGNSLLPASFSSIPLESRHHQQQALGDLRGLLETTKLAWRMGSLLSKFLGSNPVTPSGRWYYELDQLFLQYIPWGKDAGGCIISLSLGLSSPITKVYGNHKKLLPWDSGMCCLGNTMMCWTT